MGKFRLKVKVRMDGAMDGRMDQQVHLTPRLAELALISAELSASN